MKILIRTAFIISENPNEVKAWWESFLGGTKSDCIFWFSFRYKNNYPGLFWLHQYHLKLTLNNLRLLVGITNFFELTESSNPCCITGRGRGRKVKPLTMCENALGYSVLSVNLDLLYKSANKLALKLVAKCLNLFLMQLNKATILFPYNLAALHFPIFLI